MTYIERLAAAVQSGKQINFPELGHDHFAAAATSPGGFVAALDELVNAINLPPKITQVADKGGDGRIVATAAFALTREQGWQALAGFSGAAAKLLDRVTAEQGLRYRVAEVKK